MSLGNGFIVGMDVETHLEQLAAEGERLADAAGRAGWDAPVAACRWDVRTLVTHVGGVHRWAAGIVGTGTRAEELARAVGTGPGDDELLDWFRAGHAALLSTLRAAPPDLDCFTFLPAPSPRAFWARRQAHETAMHRADAESASGAITPFDAAFAQDGIAEMLHGFAQRRSNAIATAATIGLRPDDGGNPWLVTFGGERIGAVESDGDAVTVVAGSSSDIYLWLWNRPSAAEVTGDTDVGKQWRTVRVRWG
ncbi:MAG: hypothetical protein QOG22_1041 [Pseudonocardiales bacterium]|nr:hypothetical protein [Pseudonocardiales bacterium]